MRSGEQCNLDRSANSCRESLANPFSTANPTLLPLGLVLPSYIIQHKQKIIDTRKNLLDGIIKEEFDLWKKQGANDTIRNEVTKAKTQVRKEGKHVLDLIKFWENCAVEEKTVTGKAITMRDL